MVASSRATGSSYPLCNTVIEAIPRGLPFSHSHPWVEPQIAYSEWHNPCILVRSRTAAEPAAVIVEILTGGKGSCYGTLVC
jgi:hypothetical protein